MTWFDYLLCAISSLAVTYYLFMTYIFSDGAEKVKKGQIWEFRSSCNPFKSLHAFLHDKLHVFIVESVFTVCDNCVPLFCVFVIDAIYQYIRVVL